MLNDKSGTYIKRNGELSAIDLTIASLQLATKCNWMVHNDSLGSDHYPIITTVNEPPDISSQNTQQNKYNYKRADWNKFKDESRKTFQYQLHDDDISKYCSNVNTALHTAANNSIPKYKPCKRTKATPYWNKKCSDAVNRRHRAEKKMKRTKQLDDCINYRKEKATAQRVIREVQQEYWSEYCNNLSNDTKLTSVWNMAKRMTGVNNNTNIPTLVNNGKLL